MGFKITKSFVIGIFVAATALACFILGIYAMASAVGYFGKMFSSTSETQARAYLSLHYNAFMATLYLTIFGMIIATIGTVIYFTSMWQKDKLLILHLIFFVPFFICGLVAIIGSSAHKENLVRMIDSSCCRSTCQFECTLAPSFQVYHGQVTMFFVVFCNFFALYTLLHFIGCYLETSQSTNEKQDGKKLEDQSVSHISHVSDPNLNNNTFISQNNFEDL